MQGRSNDSIVVGWLLFVLDISFMLVSFFTLFIVILVLRNTLKHQQDDLVVGDDDVSDNTKVAPVSGSLKEIAKRWSRDSKKLPRLPPPDTGSSKTKVVPVAGELMLEAKESKEETKESKEKKIKESKEEEVKVNE